MTEAEWLVCTDPQKMLEFLRGKASDRKLRLLACACCRRVWHLLTDERSHKALVTCELYADGLTTKVALVAARSEAGEVTTPVTTAALSLERNRALAAAEAVMYAARPTAKRPALADDVRKAVHAALTADMIGRLSRRIPSECLLPVCDLIRDFFGPLPFRPVSLAPTILTWNDGTVVRLAQAAYDERQLPEGTLDNGRLAVLADPWKKPDAPTPTSSATCGGRGRMCGVVGSWICSWGRGK